MPIKLSFKISAEHTTTCTNWPPPVFQFYQTMDSLLVQANSQPSPGWNGSALPLDLCIALHTFKLLFQGSLFTPSDPGSI